jgi:ribosomal protein S12 methylthiotransferase accessory factor
MDRGVVVGLDGLRDPDALALLDRLDAAGIDVTVKLASTGLGVVGVYAVGCSRDLGEPLPIMATACGEAAHPDRDTAVRKALHEFAAARGRKAFMHGPLDVVRRATPPGYLDGWLTGHPPERLLQQVDQRRRPERGPVQHRVQRLVLLQPCSHSARPCG